MYGEKAVWYDTPSWTTCLTVYGGLKARFISSQELPNLYSAKLKIKKTKFEHLQALKNTLTQDYHSFYHKLSHEYKKIKKNHYLLPEAILI